MMETLTPEAKQKLKHHWEFWARPNQLPPEGEWNTWLVLAGRGFGKTRMGSEWIRKLAHQYPGCRIALVAETAADARDVMIKGDSGLLNVDPDLDEDCWSPTNRCLTWPNGTKAFTYNGTTPDQLRGPQHHFAWVDELAKFEYMQDAWDQLQFGLRLGEHPQCLVTTTPRPVPVIKKLVNDPDTVVTRGATLDNSANLAKNTIKQLYDRYAGTRLGRQELEGEILLDMPGALWQRSNIDENRVREAPEDMERIIVAVDPAASSDEGSDENGIVGVGLARDSDGYARGYVLADRSLRGTPEAPRSLLKRGGNRRAFMKYRLLMQEPENTLPSTPLLLQVLLPSYLLLLLLDIIFTIPNITIISFNLCMSISVNKSLSLEFDFLL